MRTQEVINKFLDKRFNYKASNLYSEEDAIINYSTILAQWFDDTLLINITKYSVTTTKNQNALVRGAEIKGINYHTVDNVAIGTGDLTYIYDGRL